MNPTREKTDFYFKGGILKMKFCEGAVVEVEDIIYLYCYAIEQSKGRPFGILFDTSSKHELTEEAIEYLGSSHFFKNIVAIAYVSRDLISKIRLSLLLIFERPPVRPKLFSNEEEAAAWLKEQVRDELEELV